MIQLYDVSPLEIRVNVCDLKRLRSIFCTWRRKAKIKDLVIFFTDVRTIDSHAPWEKIWNVVWNEPYGCTAIRLQFKKIIIIRRIARALPFIDS